MTMVFGIDVRRRGFHSLRMRRAIGDGAHFTHEVTHVRRGFRKVGLSGWANGQAAESFRLPIARFRKSAPHSQRENAPCRSRRVTEARR